jgi:hypothetical protein
MFIITKITLIIVDHVNYDKQAFKIIDVEIVDTYWSKKIIFNKLIILLNICIMHVITYTY